MTAAELAARIGNCASLAEVLAMLRGTPFTVVDVVLQDEFTHDVVLAAADAPGAVVLDCT